MDSNYVHFLATQALVDSLKKIFGESAKEFMPIVYKLSLGLKNQEDVNMAAQFFAKLYEQGYSSSVEAHKDALSKLGYLAKIQISTDQNSDDTQTACNV